MELKRQLDGDTLIHKERPKPWRSNAWCQFHEIFDKTTASKIEYYYFCIQCKCVVFNNAKDGNTNPFRRHTCYIKDKETLQNQKRLLIKAEDRDRFKTAAVQFVCKDLRPYYAIEGDGLIELCHAGMLFGQRYHKAKRSDLMDVIPSRNTVKSAVSEMAETIKHKITKLLQSAKETGGIAATSDTWTDSFRHLTYICVVVHINVVENEEINYHRFVLDTSEITELVKSKKVIISRIFEIFSDYGFDKQDVQSHVKIVTDRHCTYKYGLTEAGITRITCYAHIIHNLVSKMLAEPLVTVVVENASRLSSYMRNTGLNSKLKTSLNKHTPTRWNSAFMMISQIISNYEKIVEVLIEKQQVVDTDVLQLITCLQKSELNELQTFLQPFKHITDSIEGDKYETLYMVWPIYQQLFMLLVQNDTLDENTAFVAKMKSIGRNYMEKNATDFHG